MKKVWRIYDVINKWMDSKVFLEDNWTNALKHIFPGHAPSTDLIASLKSIHNMSVYRSKKFFVVETLNLTWARLRSIYAVFV